ncbi:hypothetical protein PFISCL1PPCAC_19959, partial [Pristionchus fissidentatus]
RKQKGGVDLSGSVSRFSDLHRDCFSRVKHLKVLLDSFTLQEKRQLMGEYSFEAFHLVEELLISCDVSSSTQGAIEAESGLWTLEQLLCLAPQLVGSGWQQHAIESLLKKAIYPHNVLSVRKIAIRLFLIFYQSLAVYGNRSGDLDRVFQCLLPYFPLSGGENTQSILQEYCQSAGTWDSIPSHSNRASRIISRETTNNPRERAQLLQVYLDKLLEYCCRETIRIEWDDEQKRRQCAQFILDRVIVLYIKETFPDMENNGVDIFGGWMGGESENTPLDTADPIVIARYWLIRWMTNVASAIQLSPEIAHGGVLLYHSVLFSSQSATNSLLTLLGEAMKLPLACANVIHKVVSLLSTWLLQSEMAPFVSNGSVSIESSSLLFIHILLSFFHSPYLDNSDRIDSCVSISFSILSSCRSLSLTTLRLQSHLPPSVWSHLLTRLIEAATRLSILTDHFSYETSSAFASTILSLLISMKVVHSMVLDDSFLWDMTNAYLEGSIWIDSTNEWTKTVNLLTRALIYYTIDVDVNEKEKTAKETPLMSVRRLREGRGVGTTERDGGIGIECDVEEPGVEDKREEEEKVFLHSDQLTHSLMERKGDVSVCVGVWRRLILSIRPSCSPSGKIASTAISTIASTLFGVGLDHLGIWLIELLVSTKNDTVISLSLLSIIESLRSPFMSPALQSICLSVIIPIVTWKDSCVLSSILSLRPHHLVVVTVNLVCALDARLIDEPSDELIGVMAQLALHSTSCEGWIMRQLTDSSTTLSQCIVCTNCLLTIGIMREDVSLISRLLTAITRTESRGPLIYLLSSSLPILNRSMREAGMISIVSESLLSVNNERVRREIEGVAASLLLSSNVPPTAHQLSSILHHMSVDKEKVLEGCLIVNSSQFPLPSFSVSRTNSAPSNNDGIFITRESCLLSVIGSSGGPMCCARTRFSRHSWYLFPLPTSDHHSSNISSWLFKSATKKRDAATDTILGAMGDILDELVGPSSKREHSLDVAPFLEVIKRKTRRYRRGEKKKKKEEVE